MIARPLSALLLLLLSAAPVWAAHEVAITHAQAEALGVRVARPQPAADAASAAYAARVVIPPHQEQVVATPLDGLLESLQVARGDTVTAGQVVAQLHSPGLVNLQRDYLQALSQERLAAEQLSRDEALFRDGIIAERRLLETRSLHGQASAALFAERETLRLSGIPDQDITALRTARHIGAKLALRSPRDGTVIEVLAVPGQRMEGAAPLLRVASLDQLWLEIRLPVELLGEVQVGARVETLDGAAGGLVTATGGAVDPQDESLLVRAEVDTGRERLRPGQFVQARIRGVTGSDSFRVPAVAVVRRGDGDFVFVRTAAGFEPVAVERVADEGQQVVVRGALNEESQIAVSGVAALKGAWMGLGGE